MSERDEEQPDDQTRPLPSAAGDPDETAALGSTPGPEADATVPVPPTRGAGSTPWSGRAEVPSLRPGDDRELAAGDWYGDEQAGRRWWLPIVWGIVLLLLIGLLGVGLWLARQAVDGGGSAPPSAQPTTSAAPTSASASPTRSPSAAPTTSAAPTAVPMPPLVGLSEGAARALLDQLDLEHRVEYRPSDQPAGTVIATDPAAGELVESRDVVRLVVATASPSPPATAPTAEPTITEPTAEPTATVSPTG